MKPLIGVGPSYGVHKLDKKRPREHYVQPPAYIEAVNVGGGVPFMLPLVKGVAEARSILSRLDGLMLTGADDIRPKHWGQKVHPKVKLMHVKRERSDFAYAAAALKLDLPTLAICGGAQIVNIVLGGSLHQHLADRPGMIEPHRKGKGKHPVEVTGRRLRRILGGRKVLANSYHHQAVNRVGRGLEVTARAPDGVIEGWDSTKHAFMVCVQWHPETLTRRKPHRALFQALVRASRPKAR
jgi:putative glutamine amidotransferase